MQCITMHCNALIDYCLFRCLSVLSSYGKMQNGDLTEASAVSSDDSSNCKERIAAIEGAEEKLVSFLSSLGNLLENPGNPDTEVNKKLIVDCYTSLSDASIIFRREVKLLEQSLRVPPTLLKKDGSATAKKLNSLLNKGH